MRWGRHDGSRYGEEVEYYSLRYYRKPRLAEVEVAGVVDVETSVTTTETRKNDRRSKVVRSESDGDSTANRIVIKLSYS